MKKYHYSSNQQAELAKLLNGIARVKSSLWQVFQDFVALAAIAISNSVDKKQYEEREDEYLEIAKRYSRDHMNAFSHGLALVVEGLESGFQDFLGQLFMALNLGDSWKGQFFTPYTVSFMMANIQMGNKDELARDIRDGCGFITISDPAVGGGVMLIASAQAMEETGINYQLHMHTTGMDISIVAVHMAYIQLSLLHVPAIIEHKDSLSPAPPWSIWKTPAHILGGGGI